MDPEALLQPSFLVPVVAVVCVLGGVVFAVLRAMIARRAQARIPRWSHAAYALWTGGEDSGTWARDRAQQSLASWYGVQSSAQFFDVIRGLRAGQTGNPAWDRVRALDLLRIGAAAGYVDDETCWRECAAIGTELQRLYQSWEQLGQAFEAGMHAWQRGRNVTDPAQTERVQRNLPTLRGTIWPAISFHTTLAVAED